MGFGAPIHWIVLLLIVLLLFGSGRLSSLMGDMAKGIKSFKKGMSEEETAAEDARTVEHRADEAIATAKEKASKS